jgi:hypothetical protein
MWQHQKIGEKKKGKKSTDSMPEFFPIFSEPLAKISLN